MFLLSSSNSSKKRWP